MLQSLMTQCKLPDCVAMKSNLSELTTHKQLFPLSFDFLPLFSSLSVLCGPSAVFPVVSYRKKLYQACRTE